MIENHGITTINSDGTIEITGLNASYFNSQDEIILEQLNWAIELLASEALKIKDRLLDNNSCSAI